MPQTFKLERATDRANITPGCGEDLGEMLAKAASLREGDFRCNPNARISSWANTVAQLYFLAADAFDQGAAASIGHNRADRYASRADGLRRRAATLEAEAKAERDATEAARLKAAFLAGFTGEDGQRFSFDARAAFIVGRHFADAGMAAPENVRATRDGIVADGRAYVVEYPGGKVAEAFARRA